MNKGLGFLILGILAILGGAIFAALVIKNKLGRDRDIDFDDFDGFEIIDDEEFDELLGAETTEAVKEEDE
jgi:hypothetical protein